MAKTRYRYEHGPRKKVWLILRKKWFWEGLLQADEKFSVREAYGEFKETQIYQTHDN